jgi:hypothetical protein
LLKATNSEYDQPVLRIEQSSRVGGAASIRIDDPSPDIEFVEADQTAPAGKYEIAVQSDKLQMSVMQIMMDSRRSQCFSGSVRVATSGCEPVTSSVVGRVSSGQQVLRRLHL